MKPVTSFVAAAVTALALLIGGAAAAQEDKAGVSEREMEKYAAAYLEVQRVVDEYKEKSDGIESEAESKAMREEYRKSLEEAVQAEGLSVEKYNEIYKRVQADPALQERALAKIEEQQSTE